MLRVAISFALASLVLWPHAASAANEKRIALAIGIGDYQNAPRLDNPGRDATAMAELFKKAGFSFVEALINVEQREFKRALQKFEREAQKADIAVVFYAGHAVELKGENYMLPVDAKLEREFDADDEAISLRRILDSVTTAKRLRLVILDACRDNPFLARMQRRTASRQVVAQGLAKVDVDTRDTLIAYAASPGATADDGDGDHSPFTTALLKHLGSPGLDIRQALGRVRDEVLSHTEFQQEPYVTLSLGGETISLVPGAVTATSPPAGGQAGAGTNSDAEFKASYELAERINTKRAWEVFIETHKSGYYVDLARERLTKFETLDQAQAERDSAVKREEEARRKAAEEDAKRDADYKKANEDARKAQEALADAERKRAEAERAADDARKAVEAAKKSGGAPVALAALPGKNDGDPAAGQSLSRSLQKELKRVGCFSGEIDGDWDAETRAALEKFSNRAKVSLASLGPSQIALDVLTVSRKGVCVTEDPDDRPQRERESTPRSRKKERSITTQRQEKPKPSRPATASRDPNKGKDCRPFNGPHGYYGNPWCK